MLESFNMNDIYNKFRKPKEQVTLKDLQDEIKNLKQEIHILKQSDIDLEYRIIKIEGKEILRKQKGKDPQPFNPGQETDQEDQDSYLNLLSLITTHKWHCV